MPRPFVLSTCSRNWLPASCSSGSTRILAARGIEQNAQRNWQVGLRDKVLQRLRLPCLQ